MSTNRRDFLKATAAGAMTMAAGGMAFGQAVASKSEVIVGKGKAETVIPKIFEKLGGIKQFVKPQSRVMIKPNMGFANPPEWGTTTSPEAVAVIARLCLEAGAARVIVCDNTLREPELCKQKSGIAAAVKDLKGVVVFVPKQDSLFEEKSHAKATALTRTSVVKEALRADCLISLPTAKSHSAAGVSLGIKGLMGLVKDRDTMHRDMDLHLAVAEQLYYIQPTLTIVDASRALLDNGPSGPGKVVQLDTFVGGVDPVAVDSYAVTLASWYGRQFEGTSVKHLKNAAELGFGNIASDKIREVPV
jgi:uncharacterized protein (DUF362 family)